MKTSISYFISDWSGLRRFFLPPVQAHARSKLIVIEALLTFHIKDFLWLKHFRFSLKRNKQFYTEPSKLKANMVKNTKFRKTQTMEPGNFKPQILQTNALTDRRFLWKTLLKRFFTYFQNHHPCDF